MMDKIKDISTKSTKKPGFLNRNLVSIVMIPLIIGIHWGWNRLQFLDSLVSEEERKDLPIVIGAKKAIDELGRSAKTNTS